VKVGAPRPPPPGNEDGTTWHRSIGCLMLESCSVGCSAPTRRPVHTRPRRPARGRPRGLGASHRLVSSPSHRFASRDLHLRASACVCYCTRRAGGEPVHSSDRPAASKRFKPCSRLPPRPATRPFNTSIYEYTLRALFVRTCYGRDSLPIFLPDPAFAKAASSKSRV
jgi:hypothetical protein